MIQKIQRRRILKMKQVVEGVEVLLVLLEVALVIVEDVVILLLQDHVLILLVQDLILVQGLLHDHDPQEEKEVQLLSLQHFFWIS